MLGIIRATANIINASLVFAGNLVIGSWPALIIIDPPHYYDKDHREENLPPLTLPQNHYQPYLIQSENQRRGASKQNRNNQKNF